MRSKIGAAAIGVAILVNGNALAQDRDVGEFSAEGNGIVVPARSWDVSAAAENQIDTVHFIEGQIVKEGDLLVTFDQGV